MIVYVRNHTDETRSTAIPATTLSIPTPDGASDAFAAFPDGGGTRPGVLMYPDAFGPRPALWDMARELAGHGYCVLVPNVFHRYRPAPVFDLPEHITTENRPALFEQIMPLIEEHTTERALSDAAAYLDFLTSRPEVSGGPVATIGYCLGAVLAMRTATAHPDRVAAVAGFHPGALVTGEPDSPHRQIPGLTAKVHLGLAENDMTPEAITEISQAFDAAGVGYSCEVYPGTVHGFTMSDTDAFDEAGSRCHWERLLALLGSTLG
ncbi:dienelactone hydrolase family protein [Amycolatopsis roodepoortensis]|uniref:Carboxymethylenebutenolidase n=1 Tax=Amycolatopsis roodepoortensis TaxID=700274 RepID=A0ABR9L8Q0_9PSEU|nr:dienelactone hydrolase family protein [Amycolatopsis roodepoortensis]MBE1577064.1 carboxymethylenebutenolidase [Amycolatopsis roodepoortensis]